MGVCLSLIKSGGKRTIDLLLCVLKVTFKVMLLHLMKSNLSQVKSFIQFRFSMLGILLEKSLKW